MNEPGTHSQNSVNENVTGAMSQAQLNDNHNLYDTYGHTSELYPCAEERQKKFPRKYSPSLKCTGLPNEGKFRKGNISFAHDSQIALFQMV